MALRYGGSAMSLAILTGALGLVSCVTANNPAETMKRTDMSVDIREVDLSPRFPQRVKSDGLISPPAPKSSTYYGENVSPTRVARSTSGKPGVSEPDPMTTGALPDPTNAAGEDKGYEINFENTPVATVAKSILGDILVIGYTIDPRVQGTVNLSSGRAIPKKDLLYVLESALRLSGVALVRDGSGYRLIPTADAAGTGSVDRARDPEAGYGISIIPLHHVSAPTLMKMLDNFAAKAGMVRAEPTRNLLVIQGNAADRRAAIDTVLSFDADWMRGQSVGIYPLINSTPEPIITELERIIDAGEGGLSQNLVKLQAVARQNAIMVVSRKPEFLKRISTWITRLDKSGAAGTGVKVYRMRYGDARQIAALLNEILLGNSLSSLDSPNNQLAPGQGSVALSSNGRPNFGGAQQRTSSGSQQQSTTATGAGFDARFADASGGRSTLGSALPNSGLARTQTPPGAVAAGAPGPILPNVRIAPDAVNNALVIYANQEDYRIIERTLHQIDRPQLQVAIDATIAEITLNDQLRYGVQLFLKSKDVGLKADQGSIVNTAATVASSALINRFLPGFNFLIGTEAEPRIILDALRTVTSVKVLSTPSIVVVDNQFASLLVGDQIPITTRTAQSVDVATAPIVNNIDYRNTGVILKVAPRINANGNVLLDVEQEISSVANNATADTLTPTISQRKVRSSISVANGQTVLLAGLISERQDRGRSGLPGVEQVPGLGELFSRNSGAMQRTELIIFIRPQIIRHGVDAARIAEELRAKLREMQPRHHGPRGATLAK